MDGVSHFDTFKKLKFSSEKIYRFVPVPKSPKDEFTYFSANIQLQFLNARVVQSCSGDLCNRNEKCICTDKPARSGFSVLVTFLFNNNRVNFRSWTFTKSIIDNCTSVSYTTINLYEDVVIRYLQQLFETQYCNVRGWMKRGRDAEGNLSVDYDLHLIDITAEIPFKLTVG